MNTIHFQIRLNYASNFNLSYLNNTVYYFISPLHFLNHSQAPIFNTNKIHFLLAKLHFYNCHLNNLSEAHLFPKLVCQGNYWNLQI